MKAIEDLLLCFLFLLFFGFFFVPGIKLKTSRLQDKQCATELHSSLESLVLNKFSQVILMLSYASEVLPELPVARY